MKCYTDFPLYQAEYYKKAPIREVEFIAYDGNKYCTIKFENVIYEIKAGYLYSEAKRLTSDFSPKKFNINKALVTINEQKR